MADLVCEPGKVFTVNELVDYIENSLKGDDGDSAYDVAVAEGFVGSEASWLESLQGDQGIPGEQGEPGDPAVDYADQSEVDTGTETAKALSPATFSNSSILAGLDTGVSDNATAITNLDNIKLTTDATGITGATVLSNAVSISQADFDNIVIPDAATLYFIPQA